MDDKLLRCKSRYWPDKETLAEFAYRTINDIFTNGTEEEKQDCIKAFYERVQWQGEIFLTLVSATNYECKFAVEKNDTIFTFDVEDWKFKLNGRYVKDANVADMLGVPMAFIDGMSFVCQHIGRVLGSQYEQEQKWLSLKIAASEVQKKLSALKKQESRTKNDFVKSVRRQAEKQLKQKLKNIGIESAKKEWWKTLESVCRFHSMPTVPKPTLRRSDVQKMQPFSGIYIEWDEEVCQYVGLSVNVPLRVREGHHRLDGDSMMSVLEFPKDQLVRVEHFYIWLLHPRKNGTPGQKVVV